MGAKFSKGGKLKQNGGDVKHDDSLDTFNKTSTLPASFRKKDEEVAKAGTLPRGGVDLNRNTSFSKRFRKSITKLVGKNEIPEEGIGSQNLTETKSEIVLPDEPEATNKDVSKEEVDARKEDGPTEMDVKTAQKIARAKFFQDLYNSKEQAHIPKPPRNRNIPSPSEKITQDADITVPVTLGTPVGKLIKKHEGEIEKQHTLTNNIALYPENESPRNSLNVYSESLTKNDGDFTSENVTEDSAGASENISMLSAYSMKATEENNASITEAHSAVGMQSYSTEKSTMQGDQVLIQSTETTLKTESVTANNENSHDKSATVTENTSEVSKKAQMDIKKEDISIVTPETQEANVMEEVSVAESKTLATPAGMEVEKTEPSTEGISNSDTEVASLNLTDDITEKVREENIEENNKNTSNEEMVGTGVSQKSEIVNDATDNTALQKSELKAEDTNTLSDTKDKENESASEGGEISENNELKESKSKMHKDSVISEQKSLENIIQGDDNNQCVEENNSLVMLASDETDLVRDTVVHNIDAPMSDMRSEGGSEGGVSTDEGIVASDDEEAKSEHQKVEVEEKLSSEKTSLEVESVKD